MRQHFNSFQASLEKKMSHGLSLLVNYTWSKSLDDMPQATRVSNTEDLNAGESYVYPLYPSNATNIPAAALVSDIKSLDRGLSDIDKPQALSFSYVYALPKLNHGNSVIRYIANGWRTSGLIQHHSGDALTAYMGTDNSLDGPEPGSRQEDFTKPHTSRRPAGAIAPRVSPALPGSILPLSRSPPTPAPAPALAMWSRVRSAAPATPTGMAPSIRSLPGLPRDEH